MEQVLKQTPPTSRECASTSSFSYSPTLYSQMDSSSIFPSVSSFHFHPLHVPHQHSLPEFIAEGFIDDIGGIGRQTLLQSRGERVNYLFSDHTTPHVGQAVFLEVRFKEAMFEISSPSLIKTIVTRLEGRITKVHPHPEIIALVRVFEKLVGELKGEWEVILAHDITRPKQKWRLVGMRPASSSSSFPPSSSAPFSSSPSSLLPLLNPPSSTCLSRRSSLGNLASSDTLELPPLLPQQQRGSPPNLQLLSSLAVSLSSSSSSATSSSSSSSFSTTPSSTITALVGKGEGEERRRKRRRSGSTSARPVLLSDEVLEKLREFKEKNQDISAIANWDLSQYSQNQ